MVRGSPEKTGGNFAVFALPSFPGGSAPEADIDEHGNRVRRRRKHVKSRAGCKSCKERKVKCDERRPACQNCMSRQLSCKYSTLLSPSNSLSPPGSPSSTRGSPSKSPRESTCETHAVEGVWQLNPRSALEGDLNMQPMKLLHQFETHTAETMMFGPELWRLGVLPLALKNDYLMHAILLMSCSQLRYLHPEEPAYCQLEAHHLSLTLKDFRSCLTEPISAANMDELISCGVLLLHHAWSVTDSVDDNSFEAGTDNLFALSAGLRSVVEQIWDLRVDSMFVDILCQSESLEDIVDFCKKFERTYDFEELFTRRSRTEPDYPYTDTVQSLIPILHVYELHLSGVNVSDVLSQINRYLFHWPCKYNSFLGNIQSNDSEALLILLAFYAIISQLLSPTTWWLRDRSEYMCRAILKRLRAQNRNWNERLEMICDYFDMGNGDKNWTTQSVSPSHIDPSLLEMG